MFVFKLLTMQDKEDVKKFYQDYKLNNREIYMPFETNSIDEWIEEMLNNSTDKTKNQNIMYLMYSDDKKLLGISIIRINLNDFLLTYWGNIGYYINLKEWRKGYGEKLFNFTLTECKNIGLEKVVIVCYKSNIASSKIIKKSL